MTLVYRVLRKAYSRNPFDGEGAFRYGGRWSSPGIRLSYASEHQSLAMLEYFVHPEKDDPPDDLVLAIAEVPDNLTQDEVPLSKLPADWRQTAAPAALAQIGDEFFERRQSCLLLVPSVVAPRENNCLLNPEHPDFGQISVRDLEPLNYDQRMFGAKRRRRD